MMARICHCDTGGSGICNDIDNNSHVFTRCMIVCKFQTFSFWCCFCNSCKYFWVFRQRNKFILVAGIISSSQSLCQSHLVGQTLKSVSKICFYKFSTSYLSGQTLESVSASFGFKPTKLPELLKNNCSKMISGQTELLDICTQASSSWAAEEEEGAGVLVFNPGMLF